MAINRREFIKAGMGGLGVLAVGSLKYPAFAHVHTHHLSFTITDAMKQMITHNAINDARCYFWVFKEAHFPAEVPGPIIVTTFNDVVEIEIVNELDEPHAFCIPGMFDSGPIDPGMMFHGSFRATKAGSFLYYDNLNAPVNRMMGLHGALVVMPHNSAGGGHAWTPYQVPTPGVQQLFDDLGRTPWFPGLRWEEGDEANGTSRFRQHVWVLHEASPRMFQEVGSLPAGEIYPAADFLQAFLRDPFSPTRNNRNAEYFMLNGQSGYFGAHNSHISPMHRVGEPVIIRVLNAGLWTHAMHLHANHYYLISRDGNVEKNPIWLDVHQSLPLETMDWLVPFMRPPDIPTVRGIGRADAGVPLTSGQGTTYPPNEELDLYFPRVGDLKAQDIDGNEIDLAVRMSPLCYPMHDHSEPSQTAQGGNYNCGLMADIDFVGDRTLPGGVVTWPNDMPHSHGELATGPAAPEGGHH